MLQLFRNKIKIDIFKDRYLKKNFEYHIQDAEPL